MFSITNNHDQKYLNNIFKKVCGFFNSLDTLLRHFKFIKKLKQSLLIIFNKIHTHSLTHTHTHIYIYKYKVK